MFYLSRMANFMLSDSASYILIFEGQNWENDYFIDAWSTGPFPCPLARPLASLTYSLHSALLASHARSAALIHSLAHSLAPKFMERRFVSMK